MINIFRTWTSTMIFKNKTVGDLIKLYGKKMKIKMDKAYINNVQYHLPEKLE